MLMEQAFLSQQHKTRSYELFSGFLKLLSDNDSKVKYAAATAIICKSKISHKHFDLINSISHERIRR